MKRPHTTIGAHHRAPLHPCVAFAISTLVATFVLCFGSFGFEDPQGLLPSAHVCAQEADYTGVLVDEIRIAGNRRVEADAILRAVRQKTGDPFTYDQISRDVRAVYNLGFFEDIQVDATRTKGRLVLTYTVIEKPQVLRVSYEGNEEVDDDAIKEVVSIRPFSVLNLSAIKANEEKIEELYSEKGFFLTEVKARVEPIDENGDEVEVIFSMDEHAKIQIQEVSFLGNAQVPDDELQSIMATRPGGVLSFLTGEGTFKEAEFETDVSRIMAYYYNKGFINVKVGQPQLRLSRDKKYLFVTLKIDEGEQHFFKEADIKGDLIREKENLLKLISLKPGDVFNYGQMRQDLERIKNLYQDDGYAYANVNPIPRVNKETQEVQLVVDVDKGQKVYFGRIEVSGNAKTRDKVIRRELAIAEGDLYSATKINRSRIRIQRLGFFETIDIKTSPSSEPNVVDVQIEVAERPTGTFQVGAGFSSVESFIATAQISQNNLFGRGQSLSLQSTLSSIRTLFQLRFSEPYLLDSFWNFSFDIFDFEFIFNDFTRSSTGGNITIGYPLTRLDFMRDLDDSLDWDLGVISVAGTYKLEDVGVEAGGRNGGGTSRSVSRLFTSGLTSSLRGSVFWDRRDNRLFPSKGFFQTGSVEVADDTLGSENEFIRYTGASRWYFNVFWQFVLKFNVEAGLVRSLNPSLEVPIFERFFVGGPNSVRGFQRATLGPSREVSSVTSDPGARLRDFNIGGNKQFIFNAELEFPIFASVGVKGVLFADMGNSFDDGDPIFFTPDLFADPSNNFEDSLRTAVGFGIRWFSPIGPLRFEWGFPTRRLLGEDPLVFEFSIGNSF